MKKAKKLLVTLLVLTFVLSTFSVGFAADNDKPVSTTSAVDRAQALGILKGDDQGNLNLDKPITRAEALALIIRISGLELSSDLMKGQTVFADANNDPSLQWATGYINLGVSNKVINGFPDGTFKGNDNVTYAEMAKMILYAMNYGVTVKGAPWPAGVMAKADDLKLFDKVAAAPNLPAIRGDVVQMIDNSLTVKHLVQKGYGDTEYYEEGKEDFLYKLRIDEVVDADGNGYYVEEIARVNNRLDDDEIQLSNGEIYTLKTDVKPEEIFGKKVKIWVKRDDNKKYKDVFYVKVETAEKDNLFDTIDDTDDLAKDKITLKIADKTYVIDEDAKIFINYEEKAISKLEVGLYGNFVLERNEIVFANLFKFDNNDKGLVTKVDGDIVEFVALEDAKEDELDLDDYEDEDIFVYDKNFNVLDVKDIEEDSLIFYWTNDDDEIFIVVAGDKVEGEVERVRDAKVKIAGKSYDKADAAIVSYDKGKNYDTWDDVADVEDLTEEKVVAILALDGNIAVIRGEAIETSDTIYGVVTHAKVEREGTLSLFNKDGKTVDYTAAKRSTLNEIKQADNFDYFGEAGKDLSYAAVGFKLNRDGEISDTDFDAFVIDGTTEATDAAKDKYVGMVEKGDDRTYFNIGTDRFYVSKSTIIISAIKDNELDPAVISYDDFVSMSIDEVETSKAVVFGEVGKNAKMIVFTEGGFKGAKETYYFGVVTDNPWVGRRATTVEVNVAGEGKKEYKVDDDEAFFNKGNVVAFTLNSKDEAEVVVAAKVYGKAGSPADVFGDPDDDVYLVAGVVAEAGKSFIKVGTTNYRFASDAVIYDYKEDGGFKLNGTIRMSRISVGDYVIFAIDADKDEVKAAAVYYAKDL